MSGDAMCNPHRTRGGADKRGFLVLPQNQWRRFVSGLISKPLRRFFGLGLKTKVNGLVICASKSS
jgi:hypothetical protein